MLEMETMGWILHSWVDRWSLTVAVDMIFVISNGPIHLWSSFLVGQSIV